MDERQMLLEGASALGVALDEKQIEAFMLYKKLLLEWNEKMNLTAITDDIEVITKHFLDCLTINKALDMDKVNTLIDIGTGAGFPGLVIKIAFPHINITLVDSLKKRLNFLEEVINQLQLKKVTCIHARAENLGKQKQYREGFDVCASRAVAHLSVLSEYTIPFIKVGGYLIALKGQKLDEELIQGKKAMDLLGAKLQEVVDAAVPFTDLCHSIAKIKKIRPTSLKYPRKAGEPSKAPLS